jgi:surface antigen
VLFWDDRQARPLYRGTVALRLSAPQRLAVAAIMLGVAVATAGCSSVHLDSLMSKQDAASSTNRPDQIEPSDAVAVQVSNADLAYARAAAADVLTRGAKVNSAPWRNPQTGVGGNITLLATSRDRVGLRCRDFLASYVSGTSQAWLQGSACRSARGQWQVQSLKPLKSG